jgi:SNF2 family DNA or RNA helicase
LIESSRRKRPAGLSATLRPYQKLAQGWFEFLRNLGFGGCLADDMGLGKTIQVLSLLEHRRELNSGPSLIVVPRSLIFNWIAEAGKFAPKLRVLDQSHSQRRKGTEHLADFDLVLTTYGTLRRDAAFLKDFEFDYLILDEAQAIKNATTEAAKAARLLKGRHKLALSGTPIENHLGELWSLFDFLNPGMLGRVGRFAGLAQDADAISATCWPRRCARSSCGEPSGRSPRNCPSASSKPSSSNSMPTSAMPTTNCANITARCC